MCVRCSINTRRNSKRLWSTTSPSSCTNCKQYNTYPGSPFFGDDLCATLSGFGIFGIVMFADTDCGTALNCGAVPALPHTWGTVKMLYR